MKGTQHHPLIRDEYRMRAVALIFPSILLFSLSGEASAQSGGLFGPRDLGTPIRPGVSQFDDGLQLAPSGAFVGTGRPKGGNLFAKIWQPASAAPRLRSVSLCDVAQRPGCGHPAGRNRARCSRGAGGRLYCNRRSRQRRSVSRKHSRRKVLPAMCPWDNPHRCPRLPSRRGRPVGRRPDNLPPQPVAPSVLHATGVESGSNPPVVSYRACFDHFVCFPRGAGPVCGPRFPGQSGAQQRLPTAPVRAFDANRPRSWNASRLADPSLGRRRDRNSSRRGRLAARPLTDCQHGPTGAGHRADQQPIGRCL